MPFDEIFLAKIFVNNRETAAFCFFPAQRLFSVLALKQISSNGRRGDEDLGRFRPRCAAEYR